MFALGSGDASRLRNDSGVLFTRPVGVVSKADIRCYKKCTCIRRIAVASPRAIPI